MLRGILVVGGAIVLAIVGAVNVAAVQIALGLGGSSTTTPATTPAPAAVSSSSTTVTSDSGTVNVAPGSVSIESMTADGKVSVNVDASGVSIKSPKGSVTVNSDGVQVNSGTNSITVPGGTTTPGGAITIPGFTFPGVTIQP
jgi:hypothetical protein